jgi:heptosyltransferase II
MRKGRKRILVVNVNWLGDVLFSTVSLKAIRDRYPDAYLACLIVPRCREILEDSPDLNELIIYDEDGLQRGLLGKIKFVLFLKRKHFDTAFFFHRSSTRLLLCFLAGIPERIGYWRKKTGFLLTRKIESPPSIIHRADYFTNLIEKSGIEVHDRNCRFFISQGTKEKISQILKKENIKKDDFLIAVNPGGNWHLKRWSIENFAKLADELMEKYKAKVIITGASSDLKLAESITDRMKNNPVIACGKTSLKELAALFKFSDLVISGDSGPLHIAVCSQTPTIALFGPTSPAITGPYTTEKSSLRIIQKDTGCPIPCYKLDCKDNKCMKAIEVEDVLKQVAELISWKKTVSR